MADAREDVTEVLEQLRGGDQRAADKLLPLVYEEFRALARHYLAQERANHTLQPTALVHEAYMKLVDQTRVDWQGRNHFFAVAAQAMRRILVDHARSRQRDKRGGGRARVALDEAIALSPQKDEDVLALDEALERLGKFDARQAKVVELRFFGGMSVDEVAEALGVSKRTVEGDWTFARAWLSRELRGINFRFSIFDFRFSIFDFIFLIEEDRVTEEDLKSRLRSFALRVIRLCNSLPNTNAGRVLGNQLLRSGTSPGANYRSACRGRSRNDFVAKLAIAEEEMDESGYWLDLIMASRLFPANRVADLYKESEECTKILAASRITAKANAERERMAELRNRKSKIENRKSS